MSIRFCCFAWKEEEEFNCLQQTISEGKNVSSAAGERLSARNVCFPRLTSWHSVIFLNINRVQLIRSIHSLSRWSLVVSRGFSSKIYSLTNRGVSFTTRHFLTLLSLKQVKRSFFSFSVSSNLAIWKYFKFILLGLINKRFTSRIQV